MRAPERTCLRGGWVVRKITPPGRGRVAGRWRRRKAGDRCGEGTRTVWWAHGVVGAGRGGRRAWWAQGVQRCRVRRRTCRRRARCWRASRSQCSRARRGARAARRSSRRAGTNRVRRRPRGTARSRGQAAPGQRRRAEEGPCAGEERRRAEEGHEEGCPCRLTGLLPPLPPPQPRCGRGLGCG